MYIPYRLQTHIKCKVIQKIDFGILKSSVKKVATILVCINEAHGVQTAKHIAAVPAFLCNSAWDL